MWTSPDRWTCPACGGTETTDAPTAERRQRAIATSQRRHTRDHAEDLAALARHGAR